MWVSGGKIFQAVRDPVYGTKCQSRVPTSLHSRPKAVDTSQSEGWTEILVLLALLPWASHLASLSFSVFSCKIGLITVSPPPGTVY